MTTSTQSLSPLLFWTGAAVGHFGAIHPGWSYPWLPTAYVGAALLVVLGLVAVRWRRAAPLPPSVRTVAALAGALLVTHQLAGPADVTGLSRTGSFLLYGAALAVALWRRRPAQRTGTLLIAEGIGADRIASRVRHPERTLVLYRARDPREAETARELRARGVPVVLVEGAEHDPRAKEAVSASGLSRLVPDISERRVLVYGPRGFVRYVNGALSKLRQRA
ncbi:hypothetical protein [Nonomuraea africana]|uniref:DUF218 domain-containing protein n=1 Tax=Nonomuraea africana TaxID=46171 RepID=A0ABR9KLF9_9ACTN|nr:hypothetical protein [Nonomuraea africana]MBE1562861.1 hypothetical protein [Nonomuraea africana]